MTALAPEGVDDHRACQWAALLYGSLPRTSLDPNSPHFAGVPTPTPGSSTWREGSHGPNKCPDLTFSPKPPSPTLGHRELTHKNFNLLSNT